MGILNLKPKSILLLFGIVLLLPNTFLFSQTKPALFLTAERESFVQSKRTANDPTWAYFISQVDRFLPMVDDAYRGGEKSTALALAYRMTGNTAYRDKAIAMFKAAYMNSNFINPNGLHSFTDRNTMRRTSHHIAKAFTWLYNDWSAADKADIINQLNTWAEYWITQSGPNPKSPGRSGDFRISDSDHITMMPEMYLLFAICLENESEATIRVADSSVHPSEIDVVTSGGVVVSTSSILFSKSDWMLNDMVVSEYMNGRMKGGLWSEGTYYNPGTVVHWMRTFILNKELRGIPFPSNYHEDIMKIRLHSTFPQFNGIYSMGDISGQATFGDYFPPLDRAGHSMMLHLYEMHTDSNNKALIQNWLQETAIVDPVFPGTGNNNTGMWSLLFEDLNAPALSPQALGMNTTIFAEGEGFVASRTNWTEDASVLYFSNDRNRVDHEQADALSFDIIHKNRVITQEVSGFNGWSDRSTAHNTLLIKNDSPDGSSHPTTRPFGDVDNRVIASTSNYTYIEADATQVYNMSGFHEDIYVDHVVRKLAHMKDLNMVVVYDQIDIKQDAGTRWTKYIQHFQEEPTLSNGIYSTTSEGSRFFLKTMYPQNAVTTKVDESVLFAGHTGHVPINQRKWHLSITNPNSPNNSSYLNVLFFDDDTVTSMPVTQLMHNDTSTASANLIGTQIAGSGDDSIVMFNNDPSGVLLTAAMNYSYTTNTSGSTHYILGVDSNTKYSIISNVNNNIVTVKANPDINGTFVASNKGVLKFEITNGILGIDLPDTDNNNDIVLIPNPTKGVFTIELKNKNLDKITIYNEIGQLIKGTTSNKVDMTNLTNGLYLVKITTNDGKVITKKLIKH